MKGTILDFSIQTNSGLITSEDQSRYTFIGSEWRGERPPLRGDQVNFTPSAMGCAINIHPQPEQKIHLVIHLLQNISQQLDRISPPGKALTHFTPIDWFIKCLKNFSNISGRTSRKEYGYFVLCSLMFLGVAWVVDLIVFGGYFILSTLIAVLLFLPLLTASTRRMHDIGRSGWLLMAFCIPVLGLIVVYWLNSLAQPQANKWGYPEK